MLLATGSSDMANALARAMSSVPDVLRFVPVTHGREAVQALRRMEVSLVVSVLPLRFSYDLFADLLEEHRDVLRLTCAPAGVMPPDELQSRADRFAHSLRPPLGIDVFETAFCDVFGLRTAPGGELCGFPLADYLELIRLDGSTCSLNVRSHSRDADVWLYYEAGELVATRARRGTSPALLQHVETWSDAEFTVYEGCSARLLKQEHSAASAAVEPSRPTPALRDRLAAEYVEYTPGEGPAPCRAPTLRERLAAEYVDFAPAIVQAPAAPASAPIIRRALSFESLLEEGMACFRRRDYAGAIGVWKQAQRFDNSHKLLAYNLRLAERKLQETTR